MVLRRGAGTNLVDGENCSEQIIHTLQLVDA